MLNWPNLVSQFFNGLALGAVLALISSGLTIIYGTLGVLNLAHGAMFMLGGYAGYVVWAATGSFLLAVLGGSIFVGVVGLFIELVVIRRFYGRPPEDQILVTFGIGIVIVELVRLAFGSLSVTVPTPPILSGVMHLGFLFYPTYRIAVLVIAVLALGVLYIILYRTRLGLIVRAGIEDSGMVSILGINVYRVFLLVFGIGAMAAGFAGIIHAPVVAPTPDVGATILVETFVVVVIGGIGSFPGAVLGGLISGEILSLTSAIDPAYSEVMLFVVMTLVLMLRPEGLLGVRGRA
ncbi:branched-chain amino acid ABC transporter permease [Acidisphaera rubrifaciens]|uniref:ABC transporter amide-urea permease n=1 Tax=Acidisphaera rubrifaciens HS-AP3 TaxID=1231350 RepID=A0A0D6P8M8_9PROT|nr:branched-chain amino acid ABC transporter permease [Acidisphaera rubrifaciens]GAN77204.1 ABC transporter amide-urea permease [Acidisphaera rubrifaciens HS-AP3]